MNFLDKFPAAAALTDAGHREDPGFPCKINNHIHTPFSFSAFSSVEEAVRMASDEAIRVLGINDFYVMDGYGEFLDKCLEYKIFPLFNIELIGISSTLQEKGVRINDPNNPGRIYISGKGLAHPSILSGERTARLRTIVDESNKQVSGMVELLNRWLQDQQTGILLSVEEILLDHARKLLRERHVAKALRIKIENLSGDDRTFYGLLQKVYGGTESNKERKDIAGIEDELRARLLKAGAPAFVPEDEKAFPRMEEIRDLITEAGGLPTYPLLLDGTGGNITEFEADREKLAETLQGWGFRSIEFIPRRNRFDLLKEYAAYFYSEGFVVSFGTEHNTTAPAPLTVSCKDEVALDDRLLEISFSGAAYQAAHQYLLAQEGPGYHAFGRSEMETLGRAVLTHYFQDFNPSI